MLRMRSQFGDLAAQGLCASLETESPTSIRFNPYKARRPADAETVPWCADGIYLPSRPQFTVDPLFHAGAYYVQEASSQFIDFIARHEGLEGKRVLDACASPGGKTTIYATHVGSRGTVVANEYVRQRVLPLEDNAQKWGLGNIAVTSADTARFSDMASAFDLVAVDAPCSGEGMFRKDDEARRAWSEQNVAQCVERQDVILRNVWPALRDGGLMVYSTCTFNADEDEGVVERFDREYGDMLDDAGIDVPESWGIIVGRVGNFSTFRFLPSALKGEGLFVAVARKRSIDSAPRNRKAMKFQPLSRSDAAECGRWLDCPEQFRFISIGEHAYAVRESEADFISMVSGCVPTVYSGIRIGKLYSGRLRPEHPLALSVNLNPEAAPRAEVDLETALSYLRRNDVPPAPFAEGVNIVEYGGLPLGFVKRIGQRCNNMYPAGMRILNL